MVDRIEVPLIVGDIDTGNLAGLSIGAILLALTFRTLWRQEGGWRSVLTASREDATLARQDAAVAREDAAQAREDAAAARVEAQTARNAERECQRRLGALQAQVDQLAERSASSRDRLDRLESGEHPIVDGGPEAG